MAAMALMEHTPTSTQRAAPPGSARSALSDASTARERRRETTEATTMQVNATPARGTARPPTTPVRLLRQTAEATTSAIKVRRQDKRVRSACNPESIR